MTRTSFLAAVLATVAATSAAPGSALRAAGPESQQLQPAPAQGRTTIAELKKLIDGGKVIVLDVRSAEAYRLGHIPGAILAPLETVSARAAEWQNSTTPIVTYCS